MASRIEGKIVEQGAFPVGRGRPGRAGRAEVGGYRDRLGQRAADQFARLAISRRYPDHPAPAVAGAKGEQTLDQLHATARGLQAGSTNSLSSASSGSGPNAQAADDDE